MDQAPSHFHTHTRTTDARGADRLCRASRFHAAFCHRRPSERVPRCWTLAVPASGWVPHHTAPVLWPSLAPERSFWPPLDDHTWLTRPYRSSGRENLLGQFKSFLSSGCLSL